MNRKALSLVMAGVLSASTVFPAFATSGTVVPVAEGTDVYAGVMLHDPDARIKVEVPTLFAFVVNGSVSSADDNKGVTSVDGDILLPNVKVNVTTPSGSLPGASGGTAVYEIATVGDGIMQMTNYSTKAVENPGAGESGRVGLAVKVNGNIKNEGEAADRNNWTYIGALNSTKLVPVTSEFKNYNISIDGKSLDTFVDGGYELLVNTTTDNRITLDAPANIVSGTNLDGTTQLAINGTVKALAFDVAVGGAKSQYKQVEESAKVGTIVWTVSAEVEEDVYTAPENDYLNGVSGDQPNDPDDITDGYVYP